MSIFDEPFNPDRATYAKGGDASSVASLEVQSGGRLPSADDWRDANANAAAVGRLAVKAYDQVTEFSNARDLLLERSYDGLIAAAEKSAGVRLDNPLRGGYWEEAGGDSFRSARLAAGGPAQADGERLRRQIEIFGQKLEELGQANPRARDAILSARIDFAPAMIARRQEEDLEAASADVPSLPLKLAGSIIGGLPGAFRDPVNGAGLMLGGGEAKAVTIAGRLGLTAFREAGVNAGIALIAQPGAQDARAELGLEAGLGHAASNVGFAALFGGIFGTAIKGVHEIRGLVSGFDRAWDKLTPEARDAAIAAVPAEAKAVVAHAARVDEADHAAVAHAPAALETSEGRQAVADAIAHAEDPYNAPPPELVLELPPAREDRARVTTEEHPARLGDVETVDGKPVTFSRLDAGELGTDATAFQYKGGGDEAGVTDRLRSVTRWDPLASGKVLVFERRDGSRVVADGHQRLGLAKRLQAENPDGRVQLDGFVFREADGWTPQDVRALAAKKNMQEGSGDALDAARVLRDRPDLADGSLPVSGPMMKNALSLARLSDEAWGLAVNGVVPPNYAAAVGAMVADPLQHAAVLSLLAKAQPETERAAKLLIGEALEAGFTPEHQIDLFGASGASRSLMVERVQVLDAAMTALRRDKRLFGTLAEKADAIEQAGNVLARDVNETKATVAAQLEDILGRIARRPGPVSDSLNRMAARLAEGEKVGKVAREFLNDVEGVLDRDGLSGLLAAPELAPARVVEPGTPEAAQAAQEAHPDQAALFGGEAPAKPGEAAPDPNTGKREAIAPGAEPQTVADFRAGQAGLQIEELHARAEAFQPDLAAAGVEIAKATGTKFADPGVKNRETAAEKIARKGYDDASSLTDLARGGFLVDTPVQADAIVAELGRRFTILDEGWSTSPAGYTDRKVLVQAPSGVVAEVQIAAALVFQAKKNGGQRLYDAIRAGGGGKLHELIAQSRELYAAALELSDPAWKSVGGTDKSPNEANVARQVGSSIVAPEDATSPASTLDQGASGLSLAKAEPLSAESTAGRQSQLTKITVDPSELNVGADAKPGNGVSSEKTPSGEQTLIPGVTPIGDRQRLEAAAAAPLRGGEAPAGGLFDEAARAQADMFQQAERVELAADLVASCKAA